ncbi:MAG TPA: PDZ domain-containing protein [Kofleriaceae bacterium]|nr:PDZ domain-containing protein [Kofleriaceae bacterium]
MRRVGLVALVGSFIASTALGAPRSSNPAFLGIQMQDGGGHGPCMIEAATRESPAEAAGLRGGDIVLSVDGKPIANCGVLLDEITSHAPGDTVQVKVQRLSSHLAVRVQLTTRDALLHKVIGKPMVETNLVGVEDSEIYDLSALHGRMAIVGLYNPACVDCAQLFTKFLEWTRDKARKGGPNALVLAVVARDALHDPVALQRSLDVPLAIGELTAPAQEGASSPFSRELVISDRDRLGVLLIDGRGTVQYVGPIAPNSDDTEAVLDELFAAAEQAARHAR